MATKKKPVETRVEKPNLLAALNNLPPAPDISKHLNIFNAKITALLIVIGIVIYHIILFLSYVGSDSCKWLLSDGRFQGSMWQPYGCMMHTYTQSDSRMCMHYISYWKHTNNMVFIGDRRMRDMYYEFVHTVLEENQHDIERRSLSYQKMNGSLLLSEHYEDPSIGLSVEYIAHPFIGEEYIHTLNDWLRPTTPRSQRPTFVIAGCDLVFVDPTKPLKPNIEQEMKENLKKATDLFESLISDSRKSDSGESMTIIWNLQDPKWSNVSTNASKARSHLIDQFNRNALDQLTDSKVQVWTSSRLIAQVFQKNASFENETIHTQLDTQILLNYRCNDNMYYQDGTCCARTEKPTLLQLLAGLFFFMCFVFTAIMRLACGRKIRESKAVSPDGGEKAASPRDIKRTYILLIYQILKGFSRLGLVVGYFFICDRTTFFMKENKSYTHLNFLFPLGYVMLIGLFWAKDSQHTNLLHRDQTDEWKGWMQLVILIYHYTGASQVLPIYMFIRCLVSAYLFLSAYGQFTYCYNNGDYSVHRFFKVLVRYNLLVIMLCLVMNRPYQFYYFVPLVTFWYIILFLTVALWPRQNVKAQAINSRFSGIGYLFIKLVILAVAITIIAKLDEVVFEKIFLFHPIKPLFVSQDNTGHEWWFRWSLDRYSSLFGMLFALAVALSQKYNWFDDSSNETALFRSEIAQAITALFSLGSFVAYGIAVAFWCTTKQSCNAIHPYIAFMPLLGYIFLRNIVGPIRSLYSPFFAWFGKIALELFVAQYHIWLAADTHGILVLIPNFPILNVTLTSFIFVCASQELHDATTHLTRYIVPQGWKGLLYLGLLLAFMIPVAIYSYTQ